MTHLDPALVRVRVRVRVTASTTYCRTRRYRTSASHPSTPTPSLHLTQPNPHQPQPHQPHHPRCCAARGSSGCSSRASFAWEIRPSSSPVASAAPSARAAKHRPRPTSTPTPLACSCRPATRRRYGTVVPRNRLALAVRRLVPKPTRSLAVISF